MQNISKLEENNRYYNWSHGYTKINMPWFAGSLYGFKYYVNTATTSGSIFTKHFGEKFDAIKVEPHTYYTISVFPTARLIGNTNVTLHVEIQRVAMTELTRGKDRITFNYQQLETKSYVRKNYRPPLEEETQKMHHHISLSRSVIKKDKENQNLDTMPGFNLTWYYSGIDNEIESMTVALFVNDSLSKAFVRNISTIC